MSNVKNVEAFEKLLGFCRGLGGSYIPVKKNLQLKSLSNTLAGGRAVLLAVNRARTDYENATNVREVTFDGIRALGTRIIAEMKASGVSSEIIEDARAMIRRFEGRKAVDRPPLTADEAGAEPIKKRRARGLDYGTKAHHFEKLLQTLKEAPGYQTGQPDLTIAGLEAKLQELRASNARVITTISNLQQARIARDAVLYREPNSLFDTAAAVKEHVKATFGYQSEPVRVILNVPFRKPRRI